MSDAPPDARAMLQAIVARELVKLETWSKAEAMLEEKHLKTLEALARVLKATGEDAPSGLEPAPLSEQGMADALKLLNGGK